MLCSGNRNPEPPNASRWHPWCFCLCAATLLLCGGVTSHATGAEPRIAATEIAGTVTSAHGPEAGVWVIAETHDFQTRFAKIVVTDEAGRYLIPELPAAKYRVWVRGYGLVDSRGADATPGNYLDIATDIASDAATAAKTYPAAHWYAMMKIPKRTDCHG